MGRGRSRRGRGAAAAGQGRSAVSIASILGGDHRKRRPVRETDWSRLYRWRGASIYESKFLMDGLKVAAESVRARWPTFSFEERLDFAQAFSACRRVSAEDEAILDFLMEAGTPAIWMTIALRLLDHPDKDRVLAFLLERVGDECRPKGNFFQALGVMRDKRALPALRAAYDGYRARLGRGPASASQADYVDYLGCCEALWKISGCPEYKHAVAHIVESGDEAVRATAGLILRGM